MFLRQLCVIVKINLKTKTVDMRETTTLILRQEFSMSFIIREEKKG